MSEPGRLPDDYKVTVCDNCFCACCWQGEFYCSEAKRAGTVVKTVGELRKHNRESEHYWNV